MRFLLLCLLTMLALLPNDLSNEVMAETLTKEYENPVFLHDWPDPTVWRSDKGVFYSFSTAGTKYNDGQGKFLASFDMVQWDTIADIAFSQKTLARLKEIGTEFWAPHIVKIHDQWLMYLTCYNSAARSSIVVLSLNSTTFPRENGTCSSWELIGTVTSSKESGIIDTIDPFVITDPETDKVWLFFGSTGGGYRVELTADGRKLAQNAEYIRTFGLTLNDDSSREHVFESAYLYQHNGYWYLFVSSGFYSNHTYDIKVGRSKSLTGPYVDEQGREMVKGYAKTILSTPSSNEAFWGPGGLGGIFTDDAGLTYVIYHCHSKEVPVTVAGYTPRALMVEQLYWDPKNDWPYFKGEQPQGTDRYPDFSESVHLTEIEPSEHSIDAIYSPIGQRIDHIPSGLCIIRYSDGTTEKRIMFE